jgi:hypothetical protein
VVSTLEFSGAVWRKSTRSGTGAGDNCVELAVVRTAVGVRDSKSRDGSHLVFDASAWRVFAEGLGS